MLTSTAMPLEVTSEKKKRKDAAVLAGEQRLQLWPVGSRLCHGFVHSTSPGDLIVCQSQPSIQKEIVKSTQLLRLLHSYVTKAPFLCNVIIFFYSRSKIWSTMGDDIYSE